MNGHDRHAISVSASTRPIRLVDAAALDTDYPFVAAEVVRNISAEQLVEIESLWAPARDSGLQYAKTQGTHVEHAHWDWRRKVESVGAGRHCVMGFAVKIVIKD